MDSSARYRTILLALTLPILFAALLTLPLWVAPPPGVQIHEARPVAVMGTSCRLAAVGSAAAARIALRDAEAELRRVEALMSDWIEGSEISRLNRAAAGEWIELSEETLEVLRAARDLCERTQGAFDATCRPLVELWRSAAASGVRPSRGEIDRARASSRWELIELGAGAARKSAATAQIDLGGIAKGYAIDRAAGAMRRAGARGGLVEVGGDLRCFGSPAPEEGWSVEILHPSGEGVLAEISPGGDAAVCTSGDCFRGFEVGGERLSHIIDPRSGEPVRGIPSVTVIAPAAMAADAWATALDVLGREGIRSLPRGGGIEALVIEGAPQDFRLLASEGFPQLLFTGEAAPVTIVHGAR